MCTVVSHPVSTRQLMGGYAFLDLVCHIGFSIILQLCSPVPMITAEFVSSFGALRRARSRTSVPHEYNTWTSGILICIKIKTLRQGGWVKSLGLP